jgi:hypothetical protein
MMKEDILVKKVAQKFGKMVATPHIVSRSAQSMEILCGFAEIS